MILTQILQPTCIKVPLDSNDKDSAITEMVDMLVASNQIENRDAILEAILIREETRSTGIGSGIAIPHGKCNTVKELVMAIGIAKDGIEFDSIDQKPVSIIVLLASPLDRTGPHIQALARISRLMLDDKFKDQLQNASSAEDVYDLINNKEHE